MFFKYSFDVHCLFMQKMIIQKICHDVKFHQHIAYRTFQAQISSKLRQRNGYGKTYLHINHHYLFTLNMLFRYCCPLKSLNVLRIIANIQYNTIPDLISSWKNFAFEPGTNVTNSYCALYEQPWPWMRHLNTDDSIYIDFFIKPLSSLQTSFANSDKQSKSGSLDSCPTKELQRQGFGTKFGNHILCFG